MNKSAFTSISCTQRTNPLVWLLGKHQYRLPGHKQRLCAVKRLLRPLSASGQDLSFSQLNLQIRGQELILIGFRAMADLRSTSPALRPQLAQRNSSTQSLSRASPSALPSTSHKGSTQKSLKAHGVGHGRHPHNRLSSYGKNLNRLAKASAAHIEEGEGSTRHHTRTKSQTPSTSPTTQNLKRNSSKVNLPRTGSKVNAKRNSSGINLQNRNGSATKLGKPGRAEKSHSGLAKGQNKFSIGDDDQDDEC